MLRANNVATIEQCADLSGPAIDSIGMGAQRYVNEAKKWLEMAAKGRNASQMRHELEKRDREIATLTRTVEELKAVVEQAKNNALNAPNLQQLQSLIAGAMQRPQALPAYDTQTAMINATGEALRPGQKPRRQRPRIAR
jgi:predicted RNase H-like nuclease (RuvC/YqgF family)